MAIAINNFLLGNQSFKSDTERKQSMLLGQLALASAAICMIYLIADPISGLFSFLHWYLLGFIISLVVVFINRAGHYMIAASILMLVTAAILSAIALMGDQNRGVYFYFVSASVTSLVFFYNRSIPIAISFVALNLIAASLAYINHIPNEETVNATQGAIQFRYIMNMVLATFSGTIAILFMIWRNNATETSLKTSNKQLEQLSTNLEKSKTRFELAVSGTKAGIYEWNILTDEVITSNRWKQLLGYTEEDNLKVDLKIFMSMIHPEDVESTSANIGKSFEEGGNYQNELRMKMRDGSYRWFLDSGIIILSDDKPSLAVGSIIDIHSRKRSEAEVVSKNEELQKANDELDRFVYSASHDMRAPLSTLLGLIEVMKLNDDPAEYHRYFDMMTSRIHDMEGFITEVTDYSRNTRLAVNMKPVNLLSLVENLKESFYTLAEQSQVEINIDISDNLVINSDETRLKVILNNLMANAIKYNNTEGNRYVKVNATKQNDRCHIEIKDNGRGIAKEFQSKVFDMFVRASDDSSGSGLGLYIVKETLDKLNGEIVFESELRKGTSFTISLPTDG